MPQIKQQLDKVNIRPNIMAPKILEQHSTNQIPQYRIYNNVKQVEMTDGLVSEDQYRSSSK